MIKPLLTNKPFLAASILSILLLSFTSYQWVSEQRARKAQEAAWNEKLDQMNGQLDLYRSLLELGSQWRDGADPEKIIRAYEQLKGDLEGEEAKLVNRRVKYLEELLARSSEDNDARLEGLKDQLYTLGSRINVLQEELNEERSNGNKDLGSLKAELAKVKQQLAEKNAQLALKEKVQIITFTSTKGVKVHYLGEVTSGKANGGGMGIWVTGSIYHGEWMNNMRHGKGTFTWADGDKFEGEYLNDKREGFGVYYFKSGERYEGDWKDDKRSGQGILYDKDSNVRFDGEWQDDKPQVR